KRHDRNPRHRRSRVMKPKSWPRYMIEKRLRDGTIAYYWRATSRDLNAGFTVSGEPLGPDYATARERAELLNRHLDAWREGRGTSKDLDLRPGFATLGCLVRPPQRLPPLPPVSPPPTHRSASALT